MAELPDIIPSTPITVPAQDATVYPKLWMKSMIVMAPSPTEKASIIFDFVPYDGSGKILNAPVTGNMIPDAFALAEKDPEFAQVFGGVLKMVNKYKDVDFNKPFAVNANGTITQG